MADGYKPHGYGMRFIYKMTIESIHIAKVQLVTRFDHGGFCHLRQLQN